VLVEILRLSTTNESTIGGLSIDGRFFCWTIEDPWQQKKVSGKTRIPGGVYDLELRTEGGMNQDYERKFDWHRSGMIWLQRVPDFKWVYIHVGNKASHSAGCILVGEQANNNVIEPGFVGNSAHAYKRFYHKIASQIVASGAVMLSIKSFG